MAIRGLDRWGNCFDFFEYAARIDKDGVLQVAVLAGDHNRAHRFVGTYPKVIGKLNELIMCAELWDE